MKRLGFIFFFVLSPIVFLATSLPGCALKTAAPGADEALLSSVKREKSQEFDGVPLSTASLKDAETSKAGFAGIKRVAIIGFELSTRSPFVNEMSLNRGAAYKRALASYEKAFKKHGIDVVPTETLRKDPVWKEYDPTIALGQYIDSSGPLLRSIFTYSLPDENDKTGKEFLKALAALYLDMAKPDKQITGSVTDAVANSPVGKQVAKYASETALAMAKAQVAPPDGLTLAKRYWARYGGGERLFYIPVSYRDKPIARTAAILQTPSEWAKTEPYDGFLALLAKSLGVDAVVVIQSCLAWDTESETPGVGLCLGEPQPIVFYNSDGGVIPTPFVMMPPKPEYDRNDKETKERESKLMAKHPEAMQVMMKAMMIHQQEHNKNSLVMSGFANKWINTYVPPQIAMRTNLDPAGANQAKVSIEVYRAVVYEILDQMFRLFEEKQKFTQTMSEEQMNKAFENLAGLYYVVGWEPGGSVMSGVDELADREVNAVLKPLGR